MSLVVFFLLHVGYLYSSLERLRVCLFGHWYFATTNVSTPMLFRKTYVWCYRENLINSSWFECPQLKWLQSVNVGCEINPFIFMEQCYKFSQALSMSNMIWIRSLSVTILPYLERLSQRMFSDLIVDGLLCCIRLTELLCTSPQLRLPCNRGNIAERNRNTVARRRFGIW